jgi:hypothetical protein
VGQNRQAAGNKGEMINLYPRRTTRMLFLRTSGNISLLFKSLEIGVLKPNWLFKMFWLKGICETVSSTFGLPISGMLNHDKKLAIFVAPLNLWELGPRLKESIYLAV